MSDNDKRLEWWASALKDLQGTPREVQRVMGFAIRLAQKGEKADYAEPMKGALRDVIEIWADDDTGNGTYRTMYTVAIGDIVFVLDVFKKKAKKGIATPQKDLDRIEQRLKAAREHYAAKQQKQ